jgi:putative glutamine amidotransferase
MTRQQGGIRHEAAETYAHAIAAAGGAAAYLPAAGDAAGAATLDRLDGLLLSGGDDLPPEALDEPLHPAARPILIERWRSECAWLGAALERGLPVLGVCLGAQIIARRLGGRIIQDLPSERTADVLHRVEDRVVYHTVALRAGSLLARCAPALDPRVASNHHQAIASAPPGFRAVAASPDGVIEAIERLDGAAYCVGVQWHPELHPNQPDWLIADFVRRCEAVKR